jgi:LysR family hydrogen peroxide-inducible transcriptional activator
MPTLRQLRYLVAIADTLNFRRAAERCHISQPALSTQIQHLEARLKVQLVERSRRRVLLTAIGDEVVARARRMLQELQYIEQLAERGRHFLECTLRVGVLPSLGPYLLPHVLPYLKERYPKLTLYLREGGAEDLLRRLEEGDLELLFFPLPIARPELEAEPLFDEPLWLALPKSHRLAGKPRLEAGDLQGETILALEPGHSLYEQVLTLCQMWKANPLLDFATTSLDTLRQMAGMGIGATLLPALYVRAEARQDPQIVLKEVAAPRPSRTIGLVWRQHTARHNEYLTLAEHTRDALAAQVSDVTPLGRAGKAARVVR